MNYDIIIIGGGASGLMLAASLNLNNKRGIILEKTSRLGTKLLMSGGGRCNITHGGSIKDFISAYGDAGRFLRKPLYRHSNVELMSFLEDSGLALIEEKGRVFPESMKASDVLNIFLEKAKYNGWEIRTDSEVYGMSVSSADKVTLQVIGSEPLTASAVVVATGGITIPETGSDGSMLNLIKELDVDVTELRSALAPVSVKDYPYEELSGISIPNVTVTAFGSDAAKTCKGKAARMTGDMLFTHSGFSGPVILNISRYAEAGEILRISYNKDICDLPKRLVKVLEDRSRGPSGDVRTSKLAALLDNDDFVVEAVGENGMVTAGGISRDELDGTTMMVRRLSDPDDGYAVYAVGEAIDADGITGGYNLQMCWATAATAAESIRELFEIEA